MHKEIIEAAMWLELKKLLRDGFDLEAALELAAEKIKDELAVAEFNAYCGEHDC